MASDSTGYVHGYQPSVLRSHSWRNASNSAAYLLPHITPSMHILDVGCGPGTITMDLANYVPKGKVVGLEPASGHEVLQQAASSAKERGIRNVVFKIGDAHALPFDDNSFDITHAHQVLQHVRDPVLALQEMARVTKPHGYVAVRSTDFRGFAWFPESEGMTEWLKLYLRVMHNNGGTPDSGRRLHIWARQAGFPQGQQMVQSVGTWCFTTKAEVEWWSSLWAERLLESNFRESALKNGIATESELQAASQAWKIWGASGDAWFLAWHGELLCRL
ncbi:S-adenosyl-L-methionine-dependent methyltransferase [Aspergillus caelatus]|uniref:S-adenosyl-L-methionine-dependent methyltransferase n=2 Tax=Aspergillus subgen. Circumdati TaxID=2720871 RepID=A0A5N6ZJ65_9EURO|nr:S-adenosyl-L-methionine-dependent methyltransferase [Aspergillus caelatus]KAE8357525.1 S-adenosyl-L-methionine-dependent methyltransferase [Aspergillus caelatus]KAE8410926.1 S-adenosyl-L-methionine-dependent methyltransferase [Aspergillus pseudocaelatus]